MSTDPAWRVVTRSTLTTGMRDVIVLRAHRLRRVTVCVAETGIRLTLLAHTPRRYGERSLLEPLSRSRSSGNRTQHDFCPRRDRLGRRPAHRLPIARSRLPATAVAAQPGARVREDCRRRLNPADFAHTDGQYRAGYAAARTWLARTQPPGPGRQPP
ncbi:hypothetical protein [Streptomyces sp. NPDC053431]|uniref:hypothetical protein n=1 Tax=Streptomyces sp. NPDC053431 TaxID=3365703 RepID=UPI0037D7520B